MTVDDYSLKITVFEPLEEDTEKGDVDYWKGEIQKWRKWPKQQWPKVDHFMEIDLIVSTITGDFFSSIQEAYNKSNGASLEGMQFSQECFWRFSPKDFTEEAHSAIFSDSFTQYFDLQFPDEMPVNIFNSMSSSKQKVIAKVFLTEVRNRLHAKWQEESQYLPNESLYTLAIKQTSMGEWKGKKAQVVNNLKKIWICHSAPHDATPLAVDGYYHMWLTVSV